MSLLSRWQNRRVSRVLFAAGVILFCYLVISFGGLLFFSATQTQTPHSSPLPPAESQQIEDVVQNNNLQLAKLTNSLKAQPSEFKTGAETLEVEKVGFKAGDAKEQQTVVKISPSSQQRSTVTQDHSYSEVVHIGMMVAGAKACHDFLTVMKSILTFRSSPLFLHLLVDHASEKILQTLFATWGLDSVEVSLYLLMNLTSDVAWVHTVHQSGIYGLSKLYFEKILPHVDKIIVLDTDVLLNGDVAELWGVFDQLHLSHLMAAAEQQSPWYLSNTRWPALGVGFNTGVMLLHLQRMRDRDWRSIWLGLTKAHLETAKYTELADQDVVNLVASHDPTLMFRLDCVWNLQVHGTSAIYSHECVFGHQQKPASMEDPDLAHKSSADRKLKSNQGRINFNNIKAVHWNSPQKFQNEHPWNGKLLALFRRAKEINGYDLCEFSSNLERMVIDSVANFNPPSSDPSAAVSHGSIPVQTRLAKLKFALENVTQEIKHLILQTQENLGPCVVLSPISKNIQKKLTFTDPCVEFRIAGLREYHTHPFYILEERQKKLYQCEITELGTVPKELVPKVNKIVARSAVMAQSKYFSFVEAQRKVLSKQGFYLPNRLSAICSEIGLYSPENDEQKQNDVTLVVHFSFERLASFELLLESWKGPISASVYISHADLEALEKSFSRSKIIMNRDYIAIHLIFRTGSFYPVNYLRNVAVARVTTPFYFMADVDFILSEDAYAVILKRLNSKKSKLIQDPDTIKSTAFIVPAFETSQYKFNKPKSKSELIQRLWSTNNAALTSDSDSENKTTLPRLPERDAITIFRQFEWDAGHRATNTSRWIEARDPYAVTWEEGYEPYVILPSKSAPSYDQRFVGFGWNKVSHISTLARRNFTFVVLPDVFMIHLPHASSPDLHMFRSDPNYQTCMKTLFSEFTSKF